MIIALDYNAALRQIAGIGRYTRELVRAFLCQQSDDQLVLFFADRDLPPDHRGRRDLLALQHEFPRVRAVPIPLTERWLTIMWQRARLPLPVERWTGPVDLVHAPDFVLPPVRSAPTLLTVHDLTFRVHPETAHANLRRYLDHAVPRSLARATHVLADSQSTKRDLQRLMGVDERNITVLYPGIGVQFRRVTDDARLAEVRSRFHLPSQFLIHVGTIEPRKNLDRLMAAFDRVRRDHDGLELLLGGKPGWMSDPIVARARQTAGARLLGPIADADLPALYTLATACVYPTLYEGFGFPPLEALACGTPALVANTSSLPEIVGDLGVLVDPLDSDNLAEGIAKVIADREVRQAARERGPQQAARFTWERAGAELLGLYRRISAGEWEAR